MVNVKCRRKGREINKVCAGQRGKWRSGDNRDPSRAILSPASHTSTKKLGKGVVMTKRANLRDRCNVAYGRVGLRVRGRFW